MLKFHNVSKTYSDGFQAVKSVSFEIQKGEFLVLIGPSGCGKSTTMKMINRLVPYTDGTITIDGANIVQMNSAELRRNIGYVIQQIGLFPHYTIEKNIAIVPELKKWDKTKIRERVHHLLHMVGLDPLQFADRYPSELSGGQQQRVGVARALAADPEIILMDEPFGALDPLTRDQLQQELLSLQKKLKKTIIFVTHDMDEALRLGDRIAIMKDGELVQLDTPEKLLHAPVDQFVEDFIGKYRVAQNPELMPISDIVNTKVLTVLQAASPEKSLAQMRQHRMNTLIVVDEDKKLQALVSFHDLIAHVGKIRTIDEISIKPEQVLTVSANAKDAIIAMDNAKHGIIPVVDHENRLSGVVTRGTLLSALSSQWIGMGGASS